MNGLQISPGTEWLVLLLYLALAAGIVWQGFSKKKTRIAFAIWEITTIFYAALVVTLFLIYAIYALPMLTILVFVPVLVSVIPTLVSLTGLPIPWFLVYSRSAASYTMSQDINAAFSHIVVSALLGAVGVGFSIYALKKVKQNRAWSGIFFALGCLAAFSAITNYFISCADQCGTATSILFNTVSLFFSLLLLLSALVIYWASPKVRSTSNVSGSNLSN
jgi:hypothetical protein